jgi:hypothetical protein
MPKPYGSDTPETPAAGRERSATNRRGHRLMAYLARVEVAVSNLNPIDRLIVLNTALRNVLDDDAAREAGRHP